MGDNEISIKILNLHHNSDSFISPVAAGAGRLPDNDCWDEDDMPVSQSHHHTYEFRWWPARNRFITFSAYLLCDYYYYYYCRRVVTNRKIKPATSHYYNCPQLTVPLHIRTCTYSSIVPHNWYFDFPIRKTMQFNFCLHITGNQHNNTRAAGL